MPATFNIKGAKGKNASTAITKYRFVKLDTAAADGETVKACDAQGENAFGVAMFDVTLTEAGKGKGASVVTEGRMIVEADEALVNNALVTCQNNGRAMVALTGDHILGIVDEPASGAGKYATIRLDYGGIKA